MSRRIQAPSAVVLLAASSAVILAAAPAQYLGRQHDDLLFVIASQALSDLRYVLLTSPGRPPLAGVWPGLPALLLPVTWAAGDWTPAYQLFSALLLAACPWALWAWLRRRCEARVALLIALAFASSPLVLGQAGCVMPEAPYTLLAAALLAALERPALDASKGGWLLAASVLVRPAGLSLVPAAVARPLRERRWKDLAALLAPAAAGCFAWAAWSRAHAGYVQEATEWSASYRGRGLEGLLALPWANLRFFAAELGSSLLPASWAGGRTALAAGAVLGAAAAAGTLRLLRRRPHDPAALALAAAAAMHLFWGWQYQRYWIPLLPLAWLAAAEALGRRAAPALGLALAGQFAFHVPRMLGPSPAAAPELRAAYAWLRANSRPADAIASPLFVRDGFYAGRPSLPLAEAADAAAAAALYRKAGVRFVVWQDQDFGLSLDATSSRRRALERARGQLGDARGFRRAFEDPAGAAEVYEVLPP